MYHVLERIVQRRFPGCRLVQAAYHNRSLSLYTKLGFMAREPLSTMQGPPLAVQILGTLCAQPPTAGDLDTCNLRCV